MRALAILLALASLLVLRPALAADSGPAHSVALTAPVRALPFPRSERAQSVWASGVCWTACGGYCASGLVGCLKRDSQGQCLQVADRCDRYCQNQCRTQGGPLLPDLLDF